MVFKNLGKWLAIGLVGATVLSQESFGDGLFRMKNTSPNSNLKKNQVDFIEGSSDYGYVNLYGLPILDTYYQDSSDNSNSVAGVNIFNSKLYRCPLKYVFGTSSDSNKFNGSTNYINFSFIIDQNYTAYSSNILFTYLADANGKLRPGDARKKISEGIVTGNGREYLNVISNAVDGQIYGTNWVHIAPIETTITNASRNSDGSFHVSASARPGTVAWPEYIDNLSGGSWTALTNSPNMAQYLKVNSTNFGGFDSMTWTNLPAGTGGQRYFRLGCDSYNSGTSNLLAGSEYEAKAKSKTLEAKTETTLPAQTSDKQPFYKVFTKSRKDLAYRAR